MAKSAAASSFIMQGQSNKNEWVERQKSVRNEVTQLQNSGIDKITSDPATYQTYLDMQGRNLHISAGNIAAAIQQRPDCTVIATAAKWAKQGRTLNNGEKDNGIKALVPQPKNPQYFQVGEMYDISQTNGKEYAPNIVLKDGTLEMEKALTALSRFSPVDIEPCEMQGALYDPNDKKIFFSEEMKHGETFAALATEIGFAKTHIAVGDNYDRATYAIDGQSIGYVVSKHFGVEAQAPDTSDVAKVYKGMDTELRRDVLNFINGTSKQMSKTIENEINPPQPQRQQNRGAAGRTGNSRKNR